MVRTRSGAGGEVVTNRRKQRIAATPYDRPPPRKSPSWFSDVVVPSARAIASGAGKIISSIFSDSTSSSSENEDYASEDDTVNDNFPEIPCNQDNTLNEMMQYRQESQLSDRMSETKKIIEQLIMKETFSSEEHDWLIRVLNSRVIHWSTEAGERSSVVGSPVNKLDSAVQEAKNWFQETRTGSVRELAQGSSNLNSTMLEHVGDSSVSSYCVFVVLIHFTSSHEWFGFSFYLVNCSRVFLRFEFYNFSRFTVHLVMKISCSDVFHYYGTKVETGGCSPVDLARSYMKTRSSWMSPVRNIEFKTPSTVSMKPFPEETLYSAGHYSVPSSENRRSFASGSWDIQKELWKVRSREAEDRVCGPSTNTDPSHFAVRGMKLGSAGAGEEVFYVGERMIEPQSLRLHKHIDDALLDAGVNSLADLKSRQGSKEWEALSSKPHTSVSVNNEVPEAVQAEAECSVSKLIPPSSRNHAEELHSDLHFSKVMKSVGRENANDLPSSQLSLSTGVAHHEDQKENHMADTSSRNVNINNAEGNCELLSEAYMEVPSMSETSMIGSGGPNSSGVQHKELPLVLAQPAPVKKRSITGGEQQGRKASKHYGRSRGRGK